MFVACRCRWRISMWIGLVWLFASSIAVAQRRRYEGREVMIPMRDGVELYTQIFAPVEVEEPVPILLTRTPYEVSPLAETAGQLGPSPGFADAGYIFVHQDVRGQFRSQGEWEVLRPARGEEEEGTDEATDTYDTVEWLLDHVDGHNECVGMWGISYDGWQTVMAMADAHPALLAVSPQASPADMFVGDDLHHNGAFRLSYTYAWMAYMAARRGDANPALIGPTLNADGYEFFLEAGSAAQIEKRYFQGGAPAWIGLMEHPDYDEYWEARNALHLLDEVTPAVLHVAGWFDAEDFRGPIDLYHRVEEDDLDDQNFLVVGPWKHGGWNVRTNDGGASLGDLEFGESTSRWFAEEIELPFFEYYLRDGDDPLLPGVTAFETGGNRWHEFEQWPPLDVESRSLYLHADATANWAAPEQAASHTEFPSDPRDPVPYSAAQPVFPGPLYMVEDQRYLAEREDVVAFLTEPLEEDVVVAGRPEVTLHFATTGTDADWIVKLIDVYPDDSVAASPVGGRPLADAQILISGDIFRARYRESLAEPVRIEPGELTTLRFVLPDRMHRFRAGHRIMVQLHCSWFPLYDRNPQTYTDIYRAQESDLTPAVQTIFHQSEAPTSVSLPVLSEF